MYAPITEAEGADRTSLGLPGLQLALVKMLARMTSTPIVVSSTGLDLLHPCWTSRSGLVQGGL